VLQILRELNAKTNYYRRAASHSCGFSEDQIQELVVATGHHQIGDIYLGVVENVLPGIDAAFVNIGDTERNGFIHVTDLGPLTEALLQQLLNC